jgi:hypothetical protein
MAFEFIGYFDNLPLTSNRIEGLKQVLKYQGISEIGASQIVRSNTVTHADDRKKLLEILNRTIREVATVTHSGGFSGGGRGAKHGKG